MLGPFLLGISFSVHRSAGLLEKALPGLHGYQMAQAKFELRPAKPWLPLCVEYQRYAKAELDAEIVKLNQMIGSRLQSLAVVLSAGETRG